MLTYIRTQIARRNDRRFVKRNVKAFKALRASYTRGL